MGMVQTLEQSPLDPRVSDPGCLGTGYTDAGRTQPHEPCHGSGLITRERLAEIMKAERARSAGGQSEGPGAGPGEADPAGQGSPVPGYPA